MDANTNRQVTERRRVRFGYPDITFSIVVLILLGLGIVMMFSASYAIAINENKPGYFYALRQAIFAGIGLIVMLIFTFLDYHIWAKKGFAVIIYIASVLLLWAVQFIGTDLDTGNKRWIDLGITTFQPSELAKFAIVVLFAYLIDKNYDKMKKFTTGALPAYILLGMVALPLVFQPHYSCIILIVMIGTAMIFVGGSKWWHIAIFVLLGVAALAAIMIYMVQSGRVTYITTRFNCWLHPFDEAYLSDTWQTRQSLIAIGSGGLFGLGLGESRQKYLYLPESENDFVFAIVCEELGLVGAIMVILLFVLLIMQGFHIATHSKDKFGMMLSVGFTLQIALQAFMNIAVVANLMPNTGISLPFFSYGGTALIMQLVEMGIVLNVSRSRDTVVKVAKSVPPPEPVYRQEA